MFLKELSIKGFKSFAESAVLQLEPGITVVVGPNGSGKSNVVDAMAWVLGAQAPSAVRSHKMDDVIFAGTVKKKALGRAEVSLTIDNSEGDLPIDFVEVKITRVLYRSGDSEYSINSVPCRLLDIQELLSDSGVGKQQHIIVSQGRIDAVLNARPEDRRGIIEEAAGVLKYRKRRERAERRLASTGEDLSRLQDLAREVKRQLRPLEKQAMAAQRHGDLVQEMTTLKTHIAGRQLRALRGSLETNGRLNKELAEKDAQARRSLATLDAAILENEAKLAALGGSDTAEILSGVRSTRERIRGQLNVLTERRSRFVRELEVSLDENLVAALEAESARISAELAVASAELDAAKPEFQALEIEESALVSHQLTFDEEWGDTVTATPSRVLEVRAQVESLTVASQRNDNELKRLSEQLESVTSRERSAETQRDSSVADLAVLVDRVPTLEEQSALSHSALEEVETELEQLREQRRETDRQRSHWFARRDVLTQALDEARSQAGVEALAGADGVLGVLLELVTIDDGWEKAVEAALGGALQSIVLDTSAHAKEALQLLSAKDFSGSVTVGIDVSPGGDQSVLRRHVTAKHQNISNLLDTILASVDFVDGGWQEAFEQATQKRDRIFVTKEGDYFASDFWRLSRSESGVSGSALEEANQKAEEVDGRSKEIGVLFSEKQQELSRRKKLNAAAKQEVREVTDAQQRLKRAEESAGAEILRCEELRKKLEEQQTEIFSQKQREAEQIKLLLEELPALEQQEAESKVRAEALSSSRAELEKRSKEVSSQRTALEVKTASIQSRMQTLQTRQTETESRLEGLVAKRQEAQLRRERIEYAISQVDALAETLQEKSDLVEEWLLSLVAEQEAQSKEARQVSDALGVDRKSRQKFERELAEVRERKNRLEISDAENKVKLETLTDALRRDLDVDPEIAMTTACPELKEGISPEARVRELERELKIIGAVNPLALEEFEAVKQRNEFLQEQLEDIKKARRDLQTLIRSVDLEIVSVFSAAYADVSENFKALFTTLFPGGKGGIKLTNADDILNCGIEIEAKPSGKSVKKLSLLSGGERSLVALAFLFAVFRSRPSPFYVMDEVEAALDDTNLSRFLALLEEFRKEAQLIVVSHQKRTMEVADVLYGVSMKPGGSSKVLSEKTKEK